MSSDMPGASRARMNRAGFGIDIIYDYASPDRL